MSYETPCPRCGKMISDPLFEPNAGELPRPHHAPGETCEPVATPLPPIAVNIREERVRPHPTDGPCACACNCAARLELDSRLKGLATGGRCWACETAHRESRKPHGPREHKWDEWMNAKGLAVCGVCGGAEGTLPSECPGARMALEDEHAVYNGKKDFVNGRWHVDA